MKTHLPSAVILCASLVLFCVHSFATENQTSLTASPIATSQTSGGSTSVLTGRFRADPPLFYFRGFSRRIPLCHGTNHRYPSGGNHGGRGNHLPSAGQVLDTLFPETDKTWQEGTLAASSPELQFHAVAGNPYFSVNGQYYYVPSQVIEKDGILFLPTESLAESLGCSLEEEPETGASGCSGQVPSPRHQRILRKISTGSPGPFMRKPATSPWPGESRGNRNPQPCGPRILPRYGAGGHLCPWSVLSGGKRDHLSHSR